MSNEASLVDLILSHRGVKSASQHQAFLDPDYDLAKHDPFLLPDMQKAVDRLKLAIDRHDKVTVYGDYDVDGITSTSLLLDALPRFGLEVNHYTPDRFSEGYGLNRDAIGKLHKRGTDLILTVDNGIVSFDEVDLANQLGMDVIVTDHHSPRDTLPNAVAVVDPKIIAYRHPDNFDNHYLLRQPIGANPDLYQFCDLCGCGVAFKLVQALQSVYPDLLPPGQEKWLLDLVALGTVSDVVSLIDENRAYVKWGLEVIKKTKRPGIKALAAVAGIDLAKIDSRAIGFVLGPRLNASGRLASAELAIEMLQTNSNEKALELATKLDELNQKRKMLQNQIYDQAIDQIDPADPIAIAAGESWHEGVIGIVASKIEEKFERPTFVFSLNGDYAKASGRSFGDFSIANAITATRKLLVKGGGHVAAGGLTVERSNFDHWRREVQNYYKSLNLTDQPRFLYPEPDLTMNDFSSLTLNLVRDLTKLEPFGEANPVPVFLIQHVLVSARQTMGQESNHVRYTFLDKLGNKLQAVAFNAADRFTMMPYDDLGNQSYADIIVELSINNWNGLESVQGKLIKLTES